MQAIGRIWPAEQHLQQTIVNLVAEGLGVALVPDSMSRMQLPGAAFRPLQVAPRVEQGLFWSEHNDNPCIAGFLACATEALASGRCQHATG
ncbi:DNA-binding transcriptional activator XapR [compost metagenome]